MPRPRSNRPIFTFATPVVVNPGRRSRPVQEQQQQQQQNETLFERDPSETPFSTGDLDENDQMDELDPENINAPRVTWREPIIWTFLQVMLGIHNELAEATDTSYKERIWANAKRLFVEELTEYVERSTEFCANISVYKMQSKWDSMKRKYKDMYNVANLQTGVGGRDPADIWKFYDEMGQILKNDSSIRADVSIETYAMEESDGPHIVDNRQRNDIDEEDEEIQAARRARARNVNRITSTTIKKKVIDPSKRYAQAFINIERERHAAENHVVTNNDLLVQGTRTTGAGRNIRRIFGDRQAAGSPSANRRLNRPVNALLEAQNSSQQQFLDEMRNQTETMMEFFDEQRVKRKTDSLDVVDRLTRQLHESRREMVEEMSRKRRRDTQELLEQMYEMKQGRRPNLFATNSQYTFSSSSPFSSTRDADPSTSTNNHPPSSTSLPINNTNTNIQ